MKKNAYVDLVKCDPLKCDPEQGICQAAKNCTHKILEQEDPFEPPMLLSEFMCVGCGDCIDDCPFHAIRIRSGSGQ